MLNVNELTTTFPAQGAGADGGVRAVDGVSFHADAGQFVTLLGPSGCGKTTTLRSIAGLELPDSGEITVGGRVVFSSSKSLNVPAAKRGLGMVFQSYGIWPHMNVFDNAAFPLTLPGTRRRLGRSQVQTRVENALAIVQLDHLMMRRATALSGGQQQRLALARALVMEPPLLLLDEPLSNLDVHLRESMRSELARLQRELGITTVYVTHDQTEALAMSDRIAVMNHGKIEQFGSPREVYERPESVFVAGFIGGSNFLDGVVQTSLGAGEYLVETAAGPVRGRAEVPLTQGSRATIAVRREHVHVNAQHGSADGSTGALPGVVRLTEYLGDSVQHQVEVGGRVLRARLTSGADVPPRGTQVDVSFTTGAVRLFPGLPAAADVPEVDDPALAQVGAR